MTMSFAREWCTHLGVNSREKLITFRSEADRTRYEEARASPALVIVRLTADEHRAEVRLKRANVCRMLVWTSEEQ